LKQSLVDKIYTELKSKILLNEYPQGLLIIESDIANFYGVSKTPAREALSRLNVEGFVDVLPHKGYLVSYITLNNIKEYFQARKIVEIGCIPHLIENANAHDIAQLSMIANRTFQSKSERGYIEYLDSNFEFHMQIANMTKNTVIINILESCLNHLKRILFQDLQNTAVVEIQEDHLKIVDAIKARDEKQLAKRLSAHIDGSYNRIVGILKV